MGIENPALGNLMSNFGGEGGGATFVSALVSFIISALIVVGGVYFVIQILLGGLSWMRAGNDKASLEEARGKVLNALIGIVLLFSTWAIITLLGDVFGIDLFSFEIPVLEGVS